MVFQDNLTMDMQPLAYSAMCICSLDWGCEEECTSPRVEMTGTSGLRASLSVP